MAKRNPDEYVILILTERDLNARDRVDIAQVDKTNFRWTRSDMDQADRVDFIGRDGVSVTMKERPYHGGQKICTVGRPESFLRFEIDMPWAPSPLLY